MENTSEEKGLYLYLGFQRGVIHEKLRNSERLIHFIIDVENIEIIKQYCRDFNYEYTLSSLADSTFAISAYPNEVVCGQRSVK